MIRHIDVIATTISGSVRDWGKTERIVPLFRDHGEDDVELFAVDSHLDARRKTCELVQAGSRTIISAGGSGTFNNVLEGCYDAQGDLGNLRLGFLRKGSADLIGKTLGMPDEIEAAIEVFVNSVRNDIVVPCDVLMATSEAGGSPSRRFVGYGGAEIFGEIPHFTENRFMKYYKGLLSQFFGDLGPFLVGTNLAICSRFFRHLHRKKRQWEIVVDGETVARDVFQAMIIGNGDLGPNLPFAKDVPLGSGDFHLFTIRDKGTLTLVRQLKRAWNASILDDPERWGFQSFRIANRLTLRPDDDTPFPLNTDGSAMECRQSAEIKIVGQINLIGR